MIIITSINCQYLLSNLVRNREVVYFKISETLAKVAMLVMKKIGLSHNKSLLLQKVYALCDPIRTSSVSSLWSLFLFSHYKK